MDGYKIELTARTKHDLKEIYAYIANYFKEPDVAGKLLNKIETEILTLCNHLRG